MVTSVAIRMRRGVLLVDVHVTLSAPWTCLFGASGSGKTTTLRAIAGFERPDEGRIVVGDTVVFDAAARVWVEPYRRPVRGAMQTAWLFPGTVAKNLRAGARSSETDGWWNRIVEVFRLAGLEERRVETLSGGERQRVSLARAVVAAVYGESGPACLLLLDEPFAGMDAALRNRIAPDLQAFLQEQGVPVLSVTHDVGEALLLRAEVVRMVGGRATAQGPAAGVLDEECRAALEILEGRSGSKRATNVSAGVR